MGSDVEPLAVSAAALLAASSGICRDLFNGNQQDGATACSDQTNDGPAGVLPLFLGIRKREREKEGKSDGKL